MTKKNVIRCRFCSWTTTKFSKTSTPAKAFARLQHHIDSEHWQEAEKIDDAAAARERVVDDIIHGMPRS